MTLRKPRDMFDRQWEWDVLVSFATDESPGATLGIVSGRRRQGKSYLLEELCKATGGFYFAATEATPSESLDLLAEALSAHMGVAAPLTLGSWAKAIDVLLSLGDDARVPVVIDEFPYLCKGSPELPSVIQRAFGPRRKERLASRARLILCGSALSFMGRLLSGSAPLRGRAGVDLLVRAFDYRTAAAFWGARDPWLGLRLHSVVGGTPAYRREFVRGDVPDGSEDFDAWVCRTVLDPACPLFREARYLLSEEPDLRDASLYHSVLAAVAKGERTRGGIAQRIGRKHDTLRHPITVLEDTGLLVRDDDTFRRGRSTYRITEPLVGFYHAVMRPRWADLERPGGAKPVWRQARARYQSAVLGPHFETLCREWAQHFAAEDTWGGPAASVASGVVSDRSRRRGHEVDVVVRDPDGSLLSIGEAKLGEVMNMGHLRRLREIRDLLHDQYGLDTSATKLACYGTAGFTAELRKADDVVLVDLDRVYSGS